MLKQFRDYLRAKLQEGLWFPRLTVILEFALRRLSICQRFKDWLTNPNEKSPRGASELYQLCGLTLAFVWLAFIKLPVEPLSVAWVRYIGAAFAIYRVLEFLIFGLHWVFVARGKLHAVRRSLAGFVLNLVEVALYTSITLILIDCAPPTGSQWAVMYQNLAATFGLGLAPTAAACCCRVMTHLELITAGTLVSITIASLVGGVLREEVDPPNGAA